MNDVSSRSHSVLSLKSVQTNVYTGEKNMQKMTDLERLNQLINHFLLWETRITVNLFDKLASFSDGDSK